MRRFRFGPAEWLWRTLTYGQVQRLKATLSREARRVFLRPFENSAMTSASKVLGEL